MIFLTLFLALWIYILIACVFYQAMKHILGIEDDSETGLLIALSYFWMITIPCGLIYFVVKYTNELVAILFDLAFDGFKKLKEKLQEELNRDDI